MARGSPAKTAGKTAGRPFAKGDDPRRGAGKPGRSGRPPSAIREALRGSFADRIALLEQMADGEAVVKVKDADGNETGATMSVSPADRLKAIDMLAKYGLGTTTTQTDTEGNDAPMPGRLPADEQAAALANRLHDLLSAN